MSLYLRLVPAAAILSIAAFIPAGPAGAEQMGIKVEIGGPTTFVYVGGDPTARTGAAGICANGQGVTVNFAPQAPTQACPAVPTGTEIVSLPPSGGGEPPFPCSDQASCTALVEGLLGGGGGGSAPPGAPAQRDCTGATGGEATCVDFGEGNFLLGDPPDDGHGELGVCAGGSYFYVAGPDSPDGDAGAACPAAGPVPGAGGEPEPEPAPDGDGDGVPDADDSCPGTAAGTANGCPPQNPSGPSPSSGEGTAETGESQTTQQRPAESAAPPESPVLDITRNRLRVSRGGWVGIPLACRSQGAACVGALRLTATRRTRDGGRARIVLARAVVHLNGGGSMRRRVRLTSAGRALLARRNPLRAVAQITLDGASAASSSERLLLRRLGR